MKSTPNRSRGITFIVLGVIIFIICSIIQGIGGSNMFSDSYVRPDNMILELLMQVTWWPGWLATIGCIIYGIWQIIISRK